MSLASLEATLDAVAPQLAPGQEHYSSLFEANGVTPAKHFPNALSEALVSEILKTEELQPLLAKHLNILNTSGKISALHIAQAALHRLLAGATPNAIVLDLADFANIGECRCQTYIGICGNGIAERIDLDSNVAVMPAAISPISFARELVFGIDRWGHPTSRMWELPVIKPNLAIIVSQRIRVLTEESNIDARPIQYLEESIQRALRALTLSSGCPFTRGWQVSWLDHPSIPYEGINYRGASSPQEEAPKPRIEASEPVDAELAKRLYSILDALPTDVRARLGLAIDRLRRSRVHAPSVDTALDLGIASEIVLLSSSEGSELSYRFALHGAYLIANGQDRKAKFEAFREMYKARSTAAHEGILKAKYRNRLAEFDLLCRSAIREIVERRGFPDWKSLTLGAEG